MSPKLQPVRGTHDILLDEYLKFEQVILTLKHICTNYGFRGIETPIFEFSDVFHRTLGDTSDVVTKETYTFTDRGGESLTLRPEFTASVVRAFISNGLQDKLPFKVFYHGPAFRYERPQKGRLRQFHQFGAELLGDDNPIADAEIIAMAAHGLAELGVSEKVTLEVNSLGDAESRAAYRAALVSYFNDHKTKLSEESRVRLEKNPLRILDSKDEADKALVVNAPVASAFFTQAAKDFFAGVTDALQTLGVTYKLNPTLVRGLDYYNHTVFEFTTDALGAQGTVLAGGRYDGLVKMMGGQDIAGIGFAAGVERLLALMEACQAEWWNDIPHVGIIPVDDVQIPACLQVADELRKGGYGAELLLSGNMSKKMKKADKMKALAVIVIGEEEVKESRITLKYLSDGSQHVLPRENLVEAYNNWLVQMSKES